MTRPMINKQIDDMARAQAMAQLKGPQSQAPAVQKPTQQEPQSFDDMVKQSAMQQLFGQIQAPSKFQATDIIKGGKEGADKGGILGALGGVVGGLGDLAKTSDFRNIMAGIANNPEMGQAFLNKAQEAQQQEAGAMQGYQGKVAAQQQAQIDQFKDAQKRAAEMALEQLKQTGETERNVYSQKAETGRTSMNIASARNLADLKAADDAAANTYTQLAKTDPAEAEKYKQAYQVQREQVAKGLALPARVEREKQGGLTGFIKNITGKDTTKAIKVNPYVSQKKQNEQVIKSQNLKQV